jgi:hypothetical protein
MYKRSSASVNVYKSENAPTIKHSLRRNAQCGFIPHSGEFDSPKEYGNSKYSAKTTFKINNLKKTRKILLEKQRSGKNGEKKQYEAALQVVRRKLDFEPHSSLFYEEKKFSDELTYDDVTFVDFLKTYIPDLNSKEKLINLSDRMKVVLQTFANDTTQLLNVNIKKFKNFLQLYYRGLDSDIVESILVLVTGLASSTSVINFISIVYLFLKERKLFSLWPYVKQLFEDYGVIFLPHSGDSCNVEDSTHVNHFDLLNVFRSSYKSFKNMMNGKAFKICSQILMLLITNTACVGGLLDFNIAGFKIFNESFLKKITSKTTTTAVDVFDLIMESVDYFIEIGHLCFKHKSFKPLLFDNYEQLVKAELHVKFVSSWPAVKELDWINSGFRDEVDYREQATELIEYYKKQYAALKHLNNHEAEVVRRKWEVIESKLQEMVRLSMCGRLRKAPFAICIHGGSSVGKSSISQILTTSAVIAQGGNPSPEYATVYNPNDNFFSTYKFGTEAILLDDMCNTKPDFVKNSPVEKIIEFVNNIASYPVMADLASKGKIPLEPKVVTVTTNVEDLLSNVYSMEPVSIMRRFNLFVSVQVKEKFARNPGVAPQHLQLCPNLAREYTNSITSSDNLDIIFADLWDIYCFTIESTGNDGKALIFKKPIKSDKHGNCLPMSIREVHTMVCAMAKKHNDDQKSVVKRIADLPRALSDAYAEVYPHNRSSYELQKQSGSLEVLVHPFVPTTIGFNKWWYITPLLFSFSFTTCIFGYLSLFVYRQYVLYKKKERYIRSVLNNPITCGIISISTLSCFSILFSTILKWVVKGVVSQLRSKFASQGNLAPLSVEQLNKNSGKQNVWVKQNLERINVKGCVTMIDQQLLNKVKKNMVVVISESGVEVDKFNFVNGFFVKTNFVLIPNHFYDLMLEKRVNYLRIRSSRVEGKEDRVQRINFNKNMYFNIPGTDLGLLYVTYGVPVANLVQFFPNKIHERNIPAELVYLTSDGFRKTSSALLKHGMQTTVNTGEVFGSEYEGYSYKLDDNTPTFNGMCMGTWVSNTKPTSIIGFHLGGSTGTPHGCCGALDIFSLETAIDVVLKRNIDALNLSSEGEFDPHFGIAHCKHINPILTPDVKPDHPMLFIPRNDYIINYGDIGPTHKYRTKVEIRKYAQDFFSFIGRDIIYGPPNMNAPPKWFHFSKNLFKFAEPGIGPKSCILQRAVQDYLLPIRKNLKLFAATGNLFSRPLTNAEVLNGIHGMRFIDKMKGTSSMGFPLSGTLSEYIEGPEGSKRFKKEAEFLWDRVTQMEEDYVKGKRCYPVFTAHLKDEPKKIGSEKVRVFFGASTDLKLIVRKYYLPIVRLLSEMPLMSECAVGINSHGTDWGEMISHISFHGEDRIVAGDYSGYDQQLPLNVTQACMGILIQMAEDIGYDAESLVIMRSIVPDITTPVVNFYGSLIMLMGGNPSGQNLTVYLNSLVNSILSRCAFYSLAPSQSFAYYRKYVHQITYGDDDVGSVSTLCPWFNSVSKAEVLHSYGLTYTPPSKTGSHVAYMDLKDVDFLKRKNVYIPEISACIGALEEDSIMKSLSHGIPSKEMTEEEIFGQVIDGALHEYFAHGREKYETFREKVSEFLIRHNLQRFSQTLDVDFDARIERWRADHCVEH